MKQNARQKNQTWCNTAEKGHWNISSAECYTQELSYYGFEVSRASLGRFKPLILTHMIVNNWPSACVTKIYLKPLALYQWSHLFIFIFISKKTLELLRLAEFYRSPFTLFLSSLFWFWLNSSFRYVNATNLAWSTARLCQYCEMSFPSRLNNDQR